MYKIILIGHAGSGKDTVGDYLVANYGFKKCSLAAKIKSMAKELFSVYGYNEKEKTKYRGILQAIGEGMRRICYEHFGHPDVWNDFLATEVDALDNTVSAAEGVVVTDGRYINELEFFVAKGFLPIYICCPLDAIERRIVIRDGSFNPNAYKHASELEIPKMKKMVKAILYNDTDTKDLFRQVDNIMFNYEGILREVMVVSNER